MDSGMVDWERIKRYCFKILRLYGIWTLILIVGGQGHLWYLGATVVGVLCLSLCFYWRMKFGVMVFLAALLYSVGLLGDSYYGFLEPIRAVAVVDYAVKGYEYFFDVTRNGLFMGFPFLLIGAAFAVKKIKIKPVFAATGFFVSVAFLVAEAYTLECFGNCQDYNMFLSLLPATFFLFALAACVDLPHNDRYERMQVVGSLVYYMHMMVYIVVDLVLAVVMKFTGMNLFAWEFLATVLVSYLAAFIVWTISKRHQFAWMQYLYR